MDMQFAGQDLPVDLLYENDFSTLDDLWCEGSPEMSVKDNQLILKTMYERTPDIHFVMSAFINKVFTGDLLVTFDACSIDDESHRNFNFFIHTAMNDGRDLYETREERTGDYPEYHVMDNYLFTTLTSEHKNDDGTDMFRYRLRRDPGFRLMKEVHSYKCENHRWYKFKYLVQGNRISTSVDDLPHETYTWIDENPLTEGYLGFRTYMSHLAYRDFKCYQVK